MNPASPAPRLDGLASPLVPVVVSAQVGDLVRLASESDGTWFYCRVDALLPDGDIECAVVEAQSWPSLILDGIRPGMRYVIAANRLLSVVREA